MCQLEAQIQGAVVLALRERYGPRIVLEKDYCFFGSQVDFFRLVTYVWVELKPRHSLAAIAAVCLVR